MGPGRLGSIRWLKKGGDTRTSFPKRPSFHDLPPQVFTPQVAGEGVKSSARSTDPRDEGTHGKWDDLDSIQWPPTPFPKPGEKGSQVSTGSLSDWSWLDKGTLAHGITTAEREAHRDNGMGEVRALGPRGGQGVRITIGGGRALTARRLGQRVGKGCFASWTQCESSGLVCKRLVLKKLGTNPSTFGTQGHLLSSRRRLCPERPEPGKTHGLRGLILGQRDIRRV